MSAARPPGVHIDLATGALLVGGDKVFPIGLSNGPPLGSRTPAGRDAFDEVASAGVNAIRTGVSDWNAERIAAQIGAEQELHQTAFAHGLRCWLGLANIGNLPARTTAQASVNEQLLTRVVNEFRRDPALLAYKGVDEPRNPLRGANWVRPAGLVRAYRKVKSLDPNHPVVVIQAPRSPVVQLTRYRAALDITGVDIYPVSYPPQVHSDLRTKDINVVGALARKTRQAAGRKPFWMTLQIAFSGVIPTKRNPARVPRFPSLAQERFMAYEAIVNGARGLFFFGGHLTQVMTPQDAALGWNWTFWRRVLRPLVSELASADLRPALVAPTVRSVTARTHARDIELVTRRTRTHLYVIAVRIGGPVSLVEFGGVPRRLTRGDVLFEHVQEPLPPPTDGHQVPRPVSVKNGVFRDWFAPHDAHVYRFAL
jgi:hypothetical protein